MWPRASARHSASQAGMSAARAARTAAVCSRPSSTSATPPSSLPDASTASNAGRIRCASPYTPWKWIASAPRRLPSPITAILMSPLSTGPWKSVCGLTRFTTSTASAA